MFIQSLGCVPSFSCRSKSQEATSSVILRTIAIGLGAIALLSGLLAIKGISPFSHLGIPASISFITCGSALALLGVLLKCIKADSENNPLDLAKINPDNFNEYLEPSPKEYDFKTIKEGEVVFTFEDEQLLGFITFATKNGEIRRSGSKALKIQDGKFVHFVDGKASTLMTFKTLKEFFDYLFEHKSYKTEDAEVAKDLEYLTLRTKKGEIVYQNPYLKKH
jgi:hypothetical protein